MGQEEQGSRSMPPSLPGCPYPPEQPTSLRESVLQGRILVQPPRSRVRASGRGSNSQPSQEPGVAIGTLVQRLHKRHCLGENSKKSVCSKRQGWKAGCCHKLGLEWQEEEEDTGSVQGGAPGKDKSSHVSDRWEHCGAEA